MTAQQAGKTEGNRMFWFIAFVVAAAIIWWWLNRDETKTSRARIDAVEDRLRQAQRNLEKAAQKARETLAHAAETPSEVAQSTSSAPTTAPSAPTTAPSAPETVPTVYDDLTRINGIGEASQAILYAAGITTYRQLAALSEDEIVAIIRAGGGRKSPSMATWAAQAQALLDDEA